MRKPNDRLQKRGLPSKYGGEKSDPKKVGLNFVRGRKNGQFSCLFQLCRYHPKVWNRVTAQSCHSPRTEMFYNVFLSECFINTPIIPLLWKLATQMHPRLWISSMLRSPAMANHKNEYFLPWNQSLHVFFFFSFKIAR